ncbi:MAG: tetratricopeptide repeat protein [Sphingobium sp.]
METHVGRAIGSLIALAMTAGTAMAEDMPIEAQLSAGALATGHFERAARQLNAVPTGGVNDAARLINLGNAYAGLGKTSDARQAYLAAQRAPEAVLQTADGSEGSSRAIARRAMDRLEVSFAMR